MNWKDRLQDLAGPAIERQACLIRTLALRFEILPQGIDAHVERVRVDVDKMRRRLRLQDRFDRGGKRMRYGDNSIASSYASSYQSEPQCVRAAAYPDAMVYIA